MKQPLTSTLEDYLIAVYRLEKERGVARPRDISRRQNVAKSTVTAALQSLAEKGLINYEPYEVVTLTAEGQKSAQELATRHWILRDFLSNVLGLDPKQSEKTACGMEHALDQEGVERLICFLAFLKQHAPSGRRWLNEFRTFVRHGGRSGKCRRCVEEYLRDLGIKLTAEKHS